MLRVTLLLGLVLHKLVWEVMKHGSGAPRQTAARGASPVKAAKIAALGFLLLQTLCLNVMPISRSARGLRPAGLLLYLAGLVMAIEGRLRLGSNWVDLEDAQVLPQHAVVSSGIYRYVRHPIYAGDLLLLTGLQLALNSWLVLGVFVPLLVVVRRAVVEECQLAERLPDYDNYCARTKRFIPFVV